jgi:hypothetical protein
LPDVSGQFVVTGDAESESASYLAIIPEVEQLALIVYVALPTKLSV